MRGIILLDKPPGITSHDAVQAVRTVYKERSGHTGTLDSGVTGLLVIAVGEARKAMPAFMSLQKTYKGTMRLHSKVSEARLKKALESFTGRITQLPPKRSAVARRERERTVHSFMIKEISGQDVLFEVTTDAGVYVRKLCHDLGESLGTGAHMVSLRRTGVGPFRISEAKELEEIRKSPKDTLIPIEGALERLGLKSLSLDDEEAGKARNGRPITKVPKGLKAGELVSICHRKKLIAIGLVQENQVKVDRVLND